MATNMALVNIHGVNFPPNFDHDQHWIFVCIIFHGTFPVNRQYVPDRMTIKNVPLISF